MTTFGTSAYLKLLASNPKPRDTEIRKRLSPQNGGGYDFHKAMRQIAVAHASGAATWAETETRLNGIKNSAEQKSAISAVTALTRWVGHRKIRILDNPDLNAESPNGVFSVRFSSDFKINLAGTLTAVHIWNTLKPDMNLRAAIGTLGLFVSEAHFNSISILSLRTGELFLPANFESARDLSKILALDIEKRFSRIAAEEGKRPPKDRPEKSIRF